MERTANQLKNPFAGLSQLLERANLTGIETAGLVEARRKDIDAILEANRIVFAGAQALAQKQLEILRFAMSTARGAIAEGAFSGSPAEIATRQRDLLSRAFQMSLSHMRELADIVRKAQGDAFAVVKGQVERDVRELVGRAQGKGGGKARPAAVKKAKAARGNRRVAKKATATKPATKAAGADRKPAKKAARKTNPPKAKSSAPAAGAPAAKKPRATRKGRSRRAGQMAD